MLPIQITGQNFEIRENIREFVLKKFSKLENYTEITKIHVVLQVVNQRKSKDENDKDEPQYIATVKLHIKGHEVYTKTESGSMYKSIDLLLDKLVRQIKKIKGKNNDKE